MGGGKRSGEKWPCATRDSSVRGRDEESRSDTKDHGFAAVFRV